MSSGPIKQWAWASLRKEDDTLLRKKRLKTSQKILPASAIAQAIVKTNILEWPMWRKPSF